MKALLVMVPVITCAGTIAGVWLKLSHRHRDRATAYTRQANYAIKQAGRAAKRGQYGLAEYWENHAKHLMELAEEAERKDTR